MGLRKFFFWVFRLDKASSLFTLIQVTNPFIIYSHYHFDTLSLAVWQDTCHTYMSLVYDLAHHESPIAQWLERPTGIWKVMGLTPVGGSENSFSEYFDLRARLHYLHFIQVTNPFILHSYSSFRHVELAVWQDTCHTYKDLVYDLAHHESPIAQWLERPTGIWKVMGLTPVGSSENSFSEYFDLRTLLHYLNFTVESRKYSKTRSERKSV